MLSKLVPANLFSAPINLLETQQTIVFVHRWFAWLELIVVPLVVYIVRRQNYPREIINGLLWLTGIVAVQITLGILTVLFHVNIVAALTHQVNALELFALALYFIHRFRAMDGQ